MTQKRLGVGRNNLDEEIILLNISFKKLAVHHDTHLPNKIQGNFWFKVRLVRMIRTKTK